MNLYLISQTHNQGYDSFDSAVVCAESKKSARLTHPSTYSRYDNWDGETNLFGAWCDARFVTVQLLGKAEPGITKGVVCSSFNAG